MLEGPLYGLDVKYVMGMTDIDDKIIARAEAQAQAQGAQAQQQSQEGGGNGWLALARRHEAGFLADMSALGVAPPTALARVTEHIPEIRAFIGRIVGNGMAYALPGDGVYFDTGAFEGKGSAGTGRYGKLGGGAAASALGGGSGGSGGSGGAVDEDAAASGSVADGGVAAADGVAAQGAAAGAKRDPRDFALWKLDRGASAAAPLATEPPQLQTAETEEVAVVGAGAVTAAEGGAAAAAAAAAPGWPSPWGHGRPGWHIECSAMAHAIFGRYLALHSGGIDLAFPHHCNEIAQCDAYFGIGGGGGGAEDGGGSGCCGAGGGGSSCSAITAAGADMAGGASVDHGEWCGAFLHTGHLHIAGRKMSKSLKNFITVRQFLDGDDGGEGAEEEDDGGGVGLVGPTTTVVTADRAELFRVFCLLHKYSATVHFSPDRMRDATAVRAGLTKAVVSAARALRVEGAERRWGAAEHALAEQLQATRDAVRAALGHDFATPAALAALQSLASALRSYLPPASSATAPAPVPPELVLEVARYLARTLQMLGLAQAGGDYSCTEVGRAIAELDAAERAAFEPGCTGAGGGRTASEQGSEVGAPTVDAGSSAAALAGALLQFRADVRAAALQPRSTGSDGGAGGLQQDLLRLCDELRDAALNDAGLEVEDASSGSARAARAPKIRESGKKARADDSAVAAAAVELYSAYDDDGVPTHDVDGEPLSKAKIKKWLKKRDRKARRAEASLLAAE